MQTAVGDRLPETATGLREYVIHDRGTLGQGRPDLVSADTLGDGRTAVADMPRDVFEVDVVGAQQADECVAQLPRSPFLAQVRRLGDHVERAAHVVWVERRAHSRGESGVCLGLRESNGEPFTCSDGPAGSASVEENLRVLAPLVGSQRFLAVRELSVAGCRSRGLVRRLISLKAGST